MTRRAVKRSQGQALLICNGEFPKKKILSPILRGKPFILCADGGANTARRLGLRPHCIIGDMDSISPATRRFFRSVELMRLSDQNRPDFEKALLFLKRKKIHRVLVLGATGGRADHTVTNFSVLMRYHRTMDITLIDSLCNIRAVSRRYAFTATIGQTISLLPMGSCRGITTRGLRYSLRNETLALGVREGISNEVISSPVTISLRRGILLLFIVRKGPWFSG